MAEPPRHVVLSGYYGHGNLGDDAMMVHLLGLLRHEGAEVTAITRRPAETARRYGVAAVAPWDWRGLLRSLWAADLLILGGGGLIKDTTPSGGVEIALGLIPLARMFGVEVVAFQVGVGVIHDPAGWTFVRRILSQAVAVFVRDSASARELRAAGVPDAVVRDGVDMLFGVKWMEAAPRPEFTGGGPRVGVSLPDSYLREITLRDPAQGQFFLTTLAQVLNAEFCQLGAHLVLLGFHEDEECHDLNVLRHLRRALDASLSVEEIDVSRWSVEEVLGLYASLDFLVGMRLHALVLAVLAGVPFAGLSCDVKVLNFAHDLRVRESCYDLLGDPPASLANVIRHAWSTRAGQSARLRAIRDRLQRSAEECEAELFAFVKDATRRPALRSAVAAALLLGQIALHAAKRKMVLWRSGRTAWADHAWSRQGPLGSLVHVRLSGDQ